MLRSIGKQSGGIHVVSPEEEKKGCGGKDRLSEKEDFKREMRVVGDGILIIISVNVSSRTTV